MILYSKSSVRIAELHFDEPAQAPELCSADVIRHQWCSRAVPGTYTFQSHSIFVDLTQSEDQLLGAMDRNTRHEIRRAGKDPLTTEMFVAPVAEIAEQFFAFYDEFARHLQLGPANRSRLEGMRQRGHLMLSRVDESSDQGTHALAWHCYLRDGAWARLLHSASVRLEDHDKARNTVIGRANRYLHWSDMQAMRELGVATYDFGGWYAGQDNPRMTGINKFKEHFGGRIVDLYNTYDAVTWKGRIAVQLHRWKGGE